MNGVSAVGVGPARSAEGFEAFYWTEAGAFGLPVGPNPVRGAATLRLVLDAPEAGVVTVYDALGRRVALLHDGPLAAGAHARRFEATGLPSGVYVARTSGPAGTATQRVTLMR